jgi:hypothetical protein
MLQQEHSVSQISRQPLTPFESRFDYPDLLNLPKLMQRPKCSAARIGYDDFRGGSPLVMVLHQDSVSQFSLQPSTTSEPRFDFPDKFNTFNHRQRPKTFRHAN